MPLDVDDVDGLARMWNGDTSSPPPSWQRVMHAWEKKNPSGTQSDIRRLYTQVRRRMVEMGYSRDVQRHWKRTAQHMVRALRAGGLLALQITQSVDHTHLDVNILELLPDEDILVQILNEGIKEPDEIKEKLIQAYHDNQKLVAMKETIEREKQHVFLTDVRDTHHWFNSLQTIITEYNTKKPDQELTADLSTSTYQKVWDTVHDLTRRIWYKESESEEAKNQARLIMGTGREVASLELKATLMSDLFTLLQDKKGDASLSDAWDEIDRDACVKYMKSTYASRFEGTELTVGETTVKWKDIVLQWNTLQPRRTMEASDDTKARDIWTAYSHIHFPITCCVICV